jgi:hypothetical protein
MVYQPLEPLVTQVLVRKKKLEKVTGNYFKNGLPATRAIGDSSFSEKKKLEKVTGNYFKNHLES